VDKIILAIFVVFSFVPYIHSPSRSKTPDPTRHMHLGEVWFVKFSGGFSYTLKIVNTKYQPYQAEADSHAAYVTTEITTLEITTFPNRTLSDGYPSYPDKYLKEKLVSTCELEDKAGKTEYIGRAFYGDPKKELKLLRSNSPMPETCQLTRLK
jgi:hypothetical protein